jgi:hypothetical protein
MKKKLPSLLKEIKDKKLPIIDYATQKSISYSQMSIFRGCPHRWKLQYKDKVKRFSSSIHTVFGTAIHETIQSYLDLMYNVSTTAADGLDMEGTFQANFINEYQKQYKANNDSHFSSADEMREFFEDGMGILNWFKKKKTKYFSKRGWYLVGCEIPIVIAPNKMYNNVLYMGFLDIVMYHEPTNTFRIIDIKTSTRGWGDKDKKDENKQFQLLLYKQFFAEQYHIPIDSIEIEFFIVKRKVMDMDDEKLMSPHQAYRVQTFSPPSGKIKLNRAKTAISDFVSECFNSNGDIKEVEYPKSISKWNCMYCPFKEDKEHCGEGIIY